MQLRIAGASENECTHFRGKGVKGAKLLCQVEGETPPSRCGRVRHIVLGIFSRLWHLNAFEGGAPWLKLLYQKKRN